MFRFPSVGASRRICALACFMVESGYLTRDIASTAASGWRRVEYKLYQIPFVSSEVETRRATSLDFARDERLTVKLDECALLDAIAVAAREAGEAILEIVARGFDVEAKADTSPVTEADRAAELIILAALAVAAPGIPVIAEEEVAGTHPEHGDVSWSIRSTGQEFVAADDYTVNIGLIVRGCPRIEWSMRRDQRMHAGSSGWRGSRKAVSGDRSLRGVRRAPVACVKSHFPADRRISEAVGGGRACLMAVLEILHVARVGRTFFRACRRQAVGHGGGHAGAAAPAAGSRPDGSPLPMQNSFIIAGSAPPADGGPPIGRSRQFSGAGSAEGV